MDKPQIQRAPDSGESRQTDRNPSPNSDPNSSPGQGWGPSPDWGPPPARVGAVTTRDRAEQPNDAAPDPAANSSESVSGSGSSGGNLRVALVVVAAASLANISLQSRLGSIATALATVAMAAVIVAQAPRRRLTVFLPALLAVAAAAVTVLRSSPWVVGPCLAIVVVSLVAASQDRLLARPDWLGMSTNFVVDLFLAPGWLARVANSQTSNGRSNKPVWRGLLLAAVVVTPLTLLLVSADAAFEGLLKQAGSEGLWRHAVVTTMITVPFAAIAIATRRSHTSIQSPARAGGRPIAITMTETTIVLTSVSLLLGLWGATQVAVALGGAQRLLDTAYLTAAENARQGFFQLVAVAALLIVLIIGLDRFTDRPGKQNNRTFLALTGMVGVETLGLDLANYSRLSLYIDGFGNTMLRTSVAWFLAWLAVVMIVVVIAANTSSGVGVAAGPLFLLAGLWIVAFGIYNPEAAVAGGNLERGQSQITLDRRYLVSGLGFDAVPVLVRGLPSLPPEQAAELTRLLCSVEPPSSEYWVLGWNRSASEAAGVLDSLSCP